MITTGPETPAAEVNTQSLPTCTSVPWLGSASVAVLTVSGSPSGSLSLPSRFTTIATSGEAACVSFTASGPGFTGSIVIVPVKVPPLPSSTVTGMVTGPALSTGGVTVSSPVSGS
ncbi:hypothetical protein D9M68_847710 [compost metagenome]